MPTFTPAPATTGERAPSHIPPTNAALYGPPSPLHLAFLTENGYTGPAPRTQAQASRLCNAIAACLPVTGGRRE